MIAYTPRRCVSSITTTTSSDDQQQASLYRVPSDDDPRAFRRTSPNNMVLPQTSPRVGSLPVYSPANSRRSSASSFLSSSASSLGSYFGRMHNDDDESIYAKSTKKSPPLSAFRHQHHHHQQQHKSQFLSSLRTNFLVATLILTALFHAYATHRSSAIATDLSTLRLDLRTLLFDHNRDKMALGEAEAAEKEWRGDIDQAQKEIARASMTRSLLERDADGKWGQNEALLNKEEALRERLDRLERDIADISRMEAIER